MLGKMWETIYFLENLNLKNKNQFLNLANSALVKSANDPKDHYLIKAQISFLGQRYEEALKLVNETLSVDPKYSIALILKTKILLKPQNGSYFISDGQKYEAQEVIENAIKCATHPLDAFFAYLTYVDVIIALGITEDLEFEGLEYCDRASKISPKSPLPYLFKAKIFAVDEGCVDDERYGKALVCVDQALAIARNAEAYLLKINILKNLGKHDFGKIIECYNEALKLTPLNTQIWLDKATYINKERGRAEELKARSPQSEHASITQKIHSLFNEELKCLNNALMFHPKNPVLWNFKANLLSSYGYLREGDECYENYLLLVDQPQKWSVLQYKLPYYLTIYDAFTYFNAQENKEIKYSLNSNEISLCDLINEFISSYNNLYISQKSLSSNSTQMLINNITKQFIPLIKNDTKIFALMVYETLFTLEPTNKEFLENYLNILKEIDPLKAKRVLFNTDPTNVNNFLDYINALKVTDLAKAKSICLENYKEHAELKTPEVQKLLINLIVEEARIKGFTPSLYAFTAQHLVNNPNHVVSELSEVTEKIISQAEQNFRNNLDKPKVQNNTKVIMN
ncbi:MAG: hypothetical protein J0H68_01540 [Sphingobacteriia bacterium]|nr:hypothetical protein [Sphingobacteriia bacterium]